LHRDIFLGVKNAPAKCGVIPQGWRFGGEQILDYIPRLSPGWTAKSEKSVESAFPEDALALKLWRTEVAGFFQKRKVQDEISNCDADARRAPGWFENSERKILDWEMRFGRDLDERL
jgi:hypothetical protein